MNTEQMLAEIRDANLSYLMVAQKLIQLDKADAMSCLGVSEASADLLGALSSAQVLKLATGNTVLCRFPVDDDMVWSLLTHHRLPGQVGQIDTTASRLHALVPAAGRIGAVATEAL